MVINLPDSVKNALEMLKKNSYEAYIVGGCVRDYLMGKQPHDFDITTSANPENILRVFDGYNVYKTGLKHGTVTVLTDLPLEITTFRIDGHYSDQRRPDSVIFTKSLKEDLARRDFTVNAMAYSPDNGLQDYFNGQADLKNNLIRCVGDANERLKEDALRILRALRFASTLGFEIDESTRIALFANKELLKNISAERIAAEFIKTLSGERMKAVLTEYTDIFGVFLPELLPMKGFDQNTPYHIYDVLTHSLTATEYIPNLPHLKLAAFLHDIGKPQTYTTDEKGIGHFYGHSMVSVRLAKDILTRLKLDNRTKERVLTLIRFHDATINPTERVVKRWLNRLTPELFWDLIELKKADNLAHNPRFGSRERLLNKLSVLARKIIDEGRCFSLKELKINGTDLINLGIPQGKAIGETLTKLLDLVIDQKLENTYESLANAAKSLAGL